MKQIGKILGGVLILLIMYYGYKAYKRQQMPSNALVNISTLIDTEYHSESLLFDYYELTNSMNQQSKIVWYHYLESITESKDTDPEFVEQQKSYLQKQLLRKKIELKLIRSKTLKDQKNYDNFDIFQLENRKGFKKSPNNAFIIFSRGDESEDVEIIQEMLRELGFDILDDGFFKQETEQAIKNYQKSKKLPETGAIDVNTYKSLIKDVRTKRNE